MNRLPCKCSLPFYTRKKKGHEKEEGYVISGDFMVGGSKIVTVTVTMTKKNPRHFSEVLVMGHSVKWTY